MFGIVGFLFFPSGFKFLSFIIPLFCLCHALSSKNDYININLFIILLLLFLFIPSSLFTFDSSNPFNIEVFSNTVSAFIDTLAIIVFVGVPIFMFIAIVWAFYSGDTSQAVKILVSLLCFIGFTMIVFYGFSVSGIELGGMTSFICNFYSGLLAAIINLPISLYGGVSGIGSGLGVELPQIPSEYKSTHISLDAMYNSLKTLDYRDVVFTIHDSLPVLISLICIIVAVFMLRKEWEHQFVDFLTKISEPPRKSKKTQFFPNFNYPMAFFLVFLLTTAFIVFLSYKRSYGQDPSQDYQYIGFFGIYLVMSCVPLAIMITAKLPYYKDARLLKTLAGTLYGVLGLWLMQRLFFVKSVYNAYSVQDIEDSAIYIVNTFTFVAPSESILFSVFWPALVAGALRTYTKKQLKTLDKYQSFTGTRADLLNHNAADIKIEDDLIKYYQANQKTEKEKLVFALSVQRLVALKAERDRLLKKPDEIEVELRSIFGRGKTLVLFILLGVILPSVVFASLHFIVLSFSSNIDFFTFWLSGLGIIYFAGGCWFIFIGYRYGWLAAVLTHAFYNTSTQIFIILFTGV